MIGLGVAGGLVPCWDAIGLIVLANAVGRLALGVLLLLAFSLGMAVVLIAVGWAATRLRRLVETRDAPARPPGSLIGLGVAGGLVPCWDAIGLIVLANAVGRLALGVLLLLAFSLGMAVVLIAVGWAATRLRRLVETRDRNVPWERALGTLSGLLLAAIGLFVLAS